MERTKMRYSSAMVEMALEERDEEIQRLQEICDGYEATIIKLKVDITNLNNEINGNKKIILPYQPNRVCFKYGCWNKAVANDTLCLEHINKKDQIWFSSLGPNYCYVSGCYNVVNRWHEACWYHKFH